ncbi:MAG TPA: hypothetical protein VMX75_06660, partial [Spirochaetia bacterium]|nr:hypothetical protein [Spirochaetia bacterium]
MRISRIGLYVCFSSLLWALPLSAQAPETTENLVYSVGAFDGKDYSGTFVREDADAIYLIGNVENFLNV